jgi:hypothetical protein
MKFFWRVCVLAILVAVGLIAANGPARAGMIGDADISYHATRTVLFKGKRYSGPVWAVPGMQRHEQMINGFRLVVILRADTGMATAMLPDLNVCASFPMSRDLDLASLGEPVSHGTVAGFAAAKYRIEHEEPDGTGADGWLWVGKHHILLKLDGDYRTAGGKTVPVTAILSDIERGPQDPALFTVPSTMTVLPVEAIAPFLGFKTN